MRHVAALADNGSGQEPLGALLVKRGLITQEQLEDALAQQKTSGEPLGAIVVARGFAAPATIAQALATQHGGLLKTEYGFATGFGAGLSSPGAVGAPPVSSPRIGRNGAPVVVEPDTAIVVEAPPAPDPVSDRDAVREELTMASAETERLAEANERLVAARAELEQRLAKESQRATSLEHELAELRAGGGGPSSDDMQKWQDAVAQWQAAYGELEQRLAEREAELADLRSSVESCDAARGELERELAEARERSDSLKHDLTDVEERRAAAEAAEAERAALEAKLAEVTARADALDAEAAAAKELGGSVSDEARSELEAKLAQADEQLRAAETVRAELETRLAEAGQRASGLEQQVHEAEELRRSALASEQAIGELERQVAAAQAELAERNAQLEQAVAAASSEDARAELEAKLTALDDQLRASESVRAELEARLAALEEQTQANAAVQAQLAERDAELERLRAEVEELQRAPVVRIGPWADAQKHLLFFQGSDGYELVERDGPPPAEGAQIDGHVVTRIARSPFPGSKLPCAYLVLN
jgi:chromosome segregation ATPase